MSLFAAHPQHSRFDSKYVRYTNRKTAFGVVGVDGKATEKRRGDKIEKIISNHTAKRHGKARHNRK